MKAAQVFLALPLVFSAAAFAGGGTLVAPNAVVSHAERAALRSIERPDLGALRAGSQAAGGVSASERAALRDLEASAPRLGELRAGDLNLTDDQIKTILIVLGVILVVAIII